MLLRLIKRWSLSIVGVGAVLVVLGYSFMSDDTLAMTLAYTSSPIFLSLLIAAVGVEIGRRHDEDFVALVALWTIVSGTLGVAISQWYVFLLGGSLPDEPFYFTMSSVMVTAAFGTAAGYFYTALQRNAEELERTNELLRDRNRRLDEFASVVSHDLRNPLNIAVGYLDLARAAEDREKQEEHLDRIENAHDRMHRLIEEVLSFTREGGESYEPEDVRISQVAEKAVENVSLSKESLDVETDAVIHADAEGVQRLFENLFRNAVEHGSEGGRMESDDGVEDGSDRDGREDGDSGEDEEAKEKSAKETAERGSESAVNVEVGSTDDCVFYVEDDGSGIPEETRDKVLESGYTTKDNGTGLGLPIVRRAAEVHGWSVNVKEGKNGGARFEFVDENE